MIAHLKDHLNAAEAAARSRGVAAGLQYLRKLCLTDFAEFMWSLPDPEFPFLSDLLPRIPSAEIQGGWSGSSGGPLRQETAVFARIVQTNFEQLTHRRLEGTDILDYGCGWGRIIRAMYYFSNPDRIHGVDPYDRSIEVCREHGVLGTLAVSDYLPISLPVGEARFDLIYCYSVFTHLSPRATRSALETLRRYIKPDGVLLITIRPIEFWDMQMNVPADIVARCRQDHLQTGLGYAPYNTTPIDGDITYGETGMEISWLERNFPSWEFRRYDRGLDWCQTLIFMTPR